MFSKFQLPHELGDARVSMIAPLCVADDTGTSGYGFVVVNKQIMLGKSKDPTILTAPLLTEWA